MDQQIPKVAVLMSTYNGKDYLYEQINSIFKQEGVEITLYIRDDSSTDGTDLLVKKYALENKRIVYIEGKENLNFGKSFLTLLAQASEADYYAFSDQDDVWDSDKLICAIQLLEKQKDRGKCIYASALDVVDENLQHLNCKSYESRHCSMGSFLSRQGLAGCTMVFSDIFLNMIRPYVKKIIEEFPLNYGHDGWLLLLCYGIGGRVVIDNTPHIKYRRHGGTITNAGGGWKKRVKNEWKIFRNKNDEKQKVIKFLYEECAPLLTEDAVSLCQDILTYRRQAKTKRKLIFSKELKTNIFAVDIKNQIALLCNLY